MGCFLPLESIRLWTLSRQDAPALHRIIRYDTVATDSRQLEGGTDYDRFPDHDHHLHRSTTPGRDVVQGQGTPQLM